MIPMGSAEGESLRKKYGKTSDDEAKKRTAKAVLFFEQEGLLVSEQEGKWGLVRLWYRLFLLCFLLVPLSVAWEWNQGLVCAAILWGALGFLAFRLELPHFPVLLFLVALAVRVAIVLTVPTQPESDFLLLLDASRRLNAGDMSFLGERYFRLWAYQMGFVAYQSLFLRIWNSVYLLKLLNCLWASATVALVYLIAAKFTSDKAARLAGLVYCFLPFSLFYVTVLSNQFLSTLILYAGVYLLLSNRISWDVPKYMLFGALLALANLLRPEGAIPLLGTGLFLLLSLNRSNWRKNLASLLLMAAAYAAVSWLLSTLFIYTGLSPLGLSNNAPWWKFLLGFNHESQGMYSWADESYLQNRTMAWALVRSRILVPIRQLFSLFWHKCATFWNGGGLEWVFNFGGHSVWMNAAWLTGLSRWLLLGLYILDLLGIVGGLREKKPDDRLLLVLNQVFVTFGVYLLIEVQSRYAYHIQVSAAILAALGIERVDRRLKT